MPPVKSCSISALEENPTDVFLESSAVLLRVAGNILKDPSNPKYRSISLGSNVVTSKLLPAIGALECLFEMGFQEGVDKLILPQDSSLDKIHQIHAELKQKREAILVLNSSKHEKPSQSGENSKSNSSWKTTFVTVLKALSDLYNSTENAFLKRIINTVKDVLKYENIDLQKKALQHIPLIELQLKVERNLRKLQLAIKKKEIEDQVIDYQELLLIELLSWFKNEFFEWVDSLKCNKCQTSTIIGGLSNVVVPGADRVELHKCPKCNGEEIFPRYNDPEKLLQTRKGRCGEWANCFTLFCRSLGWDARLVVDSTDHVWTEVYSNIQKRWLHCDPCENIIDTPLMYESGWNKKLSYILAYSKDEVQDVTWRYSSNHSQVLKSRSLCKEEDLVEVIVNIRKCFLNNMSEARKKFVIKRCAMELVDLMKRRTPNDSEKEGRTSGSLAWRLARGEVNNSAEKFVPFVWKISQKEIEDKKFTLRYSTVKDEYIIGEKSKQVVKKWEKGLFDLKSVARKEETDWKMVYLARTEGSDVGFVSWKFETSSGFVISKVELKIGGTVFENGKLFCKLCAGDTCLRVPSGSEFFRTDAVSGSESITLSAELSGGKGDCAWQHSQLFRQELSSTEHKFTIIIHLEKHSDHVL